MDLSQFPHRPGIYQMLSQSGDVLYVGKARDLRKRLASYFRDSGLSVKTTALMRQVVDVNVIITGSETEALLLEANLIKKYRPRYNVLLRDDKSYPYLYLSLDQDFPRLDAHRGTRKNKGRYFGPYPSMGSIRDNLALLQKLFMIRQCKDSFFRHRSRPCLQYQIKRCTAPCVGFVSQEEYAQQIERAILFLEGNNSAVMQKIQEKMDVAAAEKHYESAALYRDQLIQLRRLQESQCVSGQKGNVDVVGVAIQLGVAAVSVLFVRQGRVIGQRLYFPQMGIADTVPAVLSSFLLQYYLQQPRDQDKIEKIVLSDQLPNHIDIATALSESIGYRVHVTDFKGAVYRQWQAMAKTNAQHALTQRMNEKRTARQQLQSLQRALNLPSSITYVECFDISHTSGESTVASCVVYDSTGMNHAAYRRFNIDGVQAADDYAAMKQALVRRYKKLKVSEKPLPDLVIIDGGKGQLRIAMNVFEELQLSDVQLIGVSKGPARKPGQEQIWLPDRPRPIHLRPDDLALHLIQLIRDEAHRFAITTHHKQRGRKRGESVLESIPGIGQVRRRELLRHFGGIQDLKNASVTEIAKVSGISRQLAQAVYDALRHV